LRSLYPCRFPEDEGVGSNVDDRGAMNFKPVTVSDYDIIKAFFINQPYNLSIYSPASIIAWSNQIFRAYYTIIDKVLFIACEAEKNPQDRHLILPLSENGSCTPSNLHHYARQFGFNQYWYAPGDYLRTLDRAELDTLFICKEQREFDDYIYLTDDLIRLK
jgi:hypothetical protein